MFWNKSGMKIGKEINGIPVYDPRADTSLTAASPESILDSEIATLTAKRDKHELDAAYWRDVEQDARKRAEAHEAAAAALANTVRQLEPFDGTTIVVQMDNPDALQI